MPEKPAASSSERPDIDRLADTVREGIDYYSGEAGIEVHPKDESLAALDELVARLKAAEARVAELEAALREAENSALKAAQLLPMTLSTSVERDHRDDHPSWAGWLLADAGIPAPPPPDFSLTERRDA